MIKNRIFITCSRGIDHYIEQEAAQLGFSIFFRTQAGIETEGTMMDAMDLNLRLRTGLRVLFLVAEFTAEDPEALYRKIHDIAWEEVIPLSGYFSITSTVDTPTIDNTRYASQKCKDAIVDRFLKKFNKRPDSGPERDRAVLHLHWQGEDCRIYIDTSGEPLSKRGYRKIPYKAPMQETLAAALVKASGWNDSGSFINPMCGSGTLAIEAALIALNRPAGILRNNFGFMHLKGYDAHAWEELRNDAKTEVKKGLQSRIIATDISPEAVEAAMKNARTAGVEHLIEFSVSDFADTEVPEGGGVVVMNPEYGERLGRAAELEKVYGRIGDFLKQKCRGYTGYVLTGNPDLAKIIGLRSSKKMLFFNGPIECRLLAYELYSGSRKSRAE
ncbi:MAG: class I SAM-dependent RNA methyltransferase [Nitrospirae bacterium]|nr:class I SAM-dependent RNA methyltransferase [Nitrospirota bacterium]